MRPLASLHGSHHHANIILERHDLHYTAHKLVPPHLSDQPARGSEGASYDEVREEDVPGKEAEAEAQATEVDVGLESIGADFEVCDGEVIAWSKSQCEGAGGRAVSTYGSVYKRLQIHHRSLLFFSN